MGVLSLCGVFFSTSGHFKLYRDWKYGFISFQIMLLLFFLLYKFYFLFKKRYNGSHVKAIAQAFSFVCMFLSPCVYAIYCVTIKIHFLSPSLAFFRSHSKFAPRFDYDKHIFFSSSDIETTSFFFIRMRESEKGTVVKKGISSYFIFGRSQPLK